MTVEPRDLDPAMDRPLLTALWTDALSSTWPLLPRAVERATAGFVAAGDAREPSGMIG